MLSLLSSLAPTPKQIAAEAKRLADELEAKHLADEDERLKAEAEQLAVLRANLHSQAVAVQNIKAMVPLQLEFTCPHYSRWRSLLLNTVEKYDLSHLILSNEDFSGHAHWRRMDFTVKS